VFCVAVVVIYTAVTGSEEKVKSNILRLEKKKSVQHITVKSKNTKTFFSFWFDLSTGSIHVTVLSEIKSLELLAKPVDKN